MGNILQKIEAAKGKIDPRFDMSIKQVDEIHQNSSDAITAICNAFTFGYAQGTRASKLTLTKRGMPNG